MKKTLGPVLIFVGIAAGLYFGVYWAFILGIASFIDQVRLPNPDALKIALSVARAFFSGAIGWFCALVFILPGMAMKNNGK